MSSKPVVNLKRELMVPGRVVLTARGFTMGQQDLMCHCIERGAPATAPAQGKRAIISGVPAPYTARYFETALFNHNITSSSAISNAEQSVIAHSKSPSRKWAMAACICR